MGFKHKMSSGDSNWWREGERLERLYRQPYKNTDEERARDRAMREAADDLRGKYDGDVEDLIKSRYHSDHY